MKKMDKQSLYKKVTNLKWDFIIHTRLNIQNKLLSIGLSQKKVNI